MPELPYGAMPVPATPIGELGRWQLDIRCGGCRRHVVLPLAYLAKRHGPTVRIATVIRGLRCIGLRGEEKCRARPSHVTLTEVYRYGNSVQKIQEIVVVQP
jgi:hypothetical protein